MTPVWNTVDIISKTLLKKNPGNMPEHNIALHSRGVFHLQGTGYPCQVWNYFQLASRQVAVLQAQVILHSPDAARLEFFTLSTVINSSCLHGFSLSTQKSLWKILVKVTGKWEASEFGRPVPTHCRPLSFLKCCYWHLSLRQRERFQGSRYHIHFIAWSNVWKNNLHWI